METTGNDNVIINSEVGVLTVPHLYKGSTKIFMKSSHPSSITRGALLEILKFSRSPIKQGKIIYMSKINHKRLDSYRQ